MGRKKKWPPAVLPHRPSGRDRVRIDGEDFWLGPSGSEEAKREYERIVFSHRPRDAAAGPTVRQVVLFWEENESSRLADKERKQYRRVLQVLLAVCGALPAADFDSAQLEAVRDAMTSASWLAEKDRAYFAKWNREPRMCAAVANRQVVRIRTVWRFLERKKQVPKGSWGELRLLRGLDVCDRRVRHRPKVRAATWEDVLAVCARIRSRVTRAMLQVQWWTGMRSGELREMRVEQIDRSRAVWLYRPASHKNSWRNQERVVAIGPQAQAILAPLLSVATGYVFVTARGTKYNTSRYSAAVRLAADKCGRGWFTPYSCRHGARLRITKECGLDAARSILGHASASTTLRYGQGFDLGAAIDAAAKLG